MRLLSGAAAATVALALALAAAPAQAANGVDATGINPASITVNDGSFEDPSANAFVNPVTGTTIPGWNITSGDVDWVGSYWQAADGSHSIDLNGHQPGTISTQISTAVGAKYFVQFALSGNPDGDPAVKTGTVEASGGTLQPFSYDTSVENNTREAMNWQTEGYVFTADSTSTTLTFTSTTGTPGSSSPYGPALDNVTVTQILASGADCKRGGWTIYQALGADNTLISFRNQGQCVSHFARNGDVPIGSKKSAPKQNTDTATQGPGAQCKNGGWTTLQVTGPDNTSLSFRNQGQCVSYFARGGGSLAGPQNFAPKQKKGND